MLISGPNRGSSWVLQPGETSLGRQMGSSVRLESSQVSKRHCTLVLENDEVLLRDDGSSNGTFVNGVLTRHRKLVPGDRISLGEYVFELVKASGARLGIAPALPPSLHGASNVLPFPVQASPDRGYPVARHSGSAAPAFPVEQPFTVATPVGPAPETDLKGKLRHWVEQQLMPLFYDLGFKQEWRVVMVGLFAAFAVGSILISVGPVLQQLHETTVREIGRRAQGIARQIVDRNAPALVASNETKAEISGLEREEGLRVAVLTDLESRILAPSSRFNQYLAEGGEARLAAAARDAFRNGRETGVLREIDERTIAAVEPVKVYNAQLGRNVVVAMAVVSLDTGLATLDAGELGVVYSRALILVALLGGVVLWIAYRTTLKPFEVLNDDIDKVLKGDLRQVTHEFKFAELDPLWEIINAGLQRVSHDSSSGAGMNLGSNPEDFMAGLRLVASAQARPGVVLCDAERRVLQLNEVFEDVSGIRSDNAVGQEISSLARDQAFSALLQELFERAQPGADAGPEEFEFSGVAYRVTVAAIGTLGGAPRGFVMMVEKKED